MYITDRHYLCLIQSVFSCYEIDECAWLICTFFLRYCYCLDKAAFFKYEFNQL